MNTAISRVQIEEEPGLTITIQPDPGRTGTLLGLLFIAAILHVGFMWMSVPMFIQQIESGKPQRSRYRPITGTKLEVQIHSVLFIFMMVIVVPLGGCSMIWGLMWPKPELITLGNGVLVVNDVDCPAERVQNIRRQSSPNWENAVALDVDGETHYFGGGLADSELDAIVAALTRALYKKSTDPK